MTPFILCKLKTRQKTRQGCRQPALMSSLLLSLYGVIQILQCACSVDASPDLSYGDSVHYLIHCIIHSCHTSRVSQVSHRSQISGAVFLPRYATGAKVSLPSVVGSSFHSKICRILSNTITALAPRTLFTNLPYSKQQ